MVYVKRLVMQGFKSFAKKTELPFTPGINVILGPNGSGKSNVSDALCFVLGRLSIKSMRAAKAKNLIFQGTKVASPSKEAIVEIAFDNTDKTFTIDAEEISIKRIVRKNGQSIYKINNEIKTRQEILTLLAQAGIDPNGFNIILQGEIQNFVRMHTEERRKVIEEVSGISIYEMRKEKSMKELEKTEEKLKEVLAILRERTTFLNNLEKERQQALKFKKLEEDLKKFKASITHFDLEKKRKALAEIEELIEKKNKEIEKIQKIKSTTKTTIESLERKIEEINSQIQKQTGFEQEKLNQEIANLRAELAGLVVKRENIERKLFEISKQKNELQEIIRNNDLSVKELQKTHSSTQNKLKERELESKKQELEKIEEQRKKFYMTKSELKSLKDRIQDKKNLLQNYTNESEFLIKQINNLGRELFDKNSSAIKVDELKYSLSEKIQILENLEKREKELEKIAYTNELEIENNQKIIDKVSKIDVCPVCKSKITENHLNHIRDEIFPKINSLKIQTEKSDKELKEILDKKIVLKQRTEQIKLEIIQRENDLVRLNNINDKKSQIKILQENIEQTKQELEQFEKRRKFLEANFDENSNVEQKYETMQIELREISIRSEENVSSEISFKQRELERAKISLKQLERDMQDLNEENKEINNTIKKLEESLEKKKKQDEELNKQFERLIGERDKLQKQVRENESQLLQKQNEINLIEQSKYNSNIDKARTKAELENLENDMLSYPNVEIIRMNRDKLIEKLNQTQETISHIGSVNLRSLEVYDEIKEEYDAIKNKVETIEKEKESILRVISQIDIKKKRTFLKTLEELNEIFSRNFSQLSTKGQVTLELENRKEPFEGGVNIIVKTGHGKYFDVTSLSGGEQTLVALSLIFGIQELKPYCFYILDEIDAALDKRNSSRLADLLKKYMQKGQYLVITHNDEVISQATNLYGVSMHDGVSKVVSLKL